MKIIYFLFTLLCVFSANVWSQNDSIEKRPQAYLFSKGEDDGVERSKAYLFSRGDARPAITRARVYEPETNKTETTKVVQKPFELERRAFELINQQRLANNLPPLEWSDDAAKIARLHSSNMASYKFFSHTGVDGTLVNDRADLLGIKKWHAIGENIAYNQGFENPVEFAVERWMQSPKHRENLLNSRWKESGIGITVTENGTYYFTEVFLARK